MKRDMNLIRRIVLATADLPPFKNLSGLEGVPESEFVMHAEWLKEAGLVAATTRVGHSESEAQFAFIFRLTWAGCEFADAIRDDTLWKKAQDKVIKPGISFTFDVFKDWLKAEIAQGFPSVGRLQ